MSKFFSIPGVTHREGRRGGEPLPIHPRASEYYASRKETSHDSSGFAPGDEVFIKGNPAVVLHEEHDSHTGKTETWVRESSQTDSGTKKVIWQPGNDARQMVVSEVRKVKE